MQKRVGSEQMIQIHTTENGKLIEQTAIIPGAWVHLNAPSEEEITQVMLATKAEKDFLLAALDEEERARLEREEDQTLILVDTPIAENNGQTFVHSTIPFGIILTEENIITVCLKETALMRSFAEGLVKGFSTKKRNRMTLQMLHKNATLFLFYLRQIDKASLRVENELHLSMKNKELIQMMGLEKSLVYFSTALKANENVLERLLRVDFVRNYPDDKDLLEDVIIENKQAIEMATIYRDIMGGTMDAFASVISNNLNIVMKTLTSITIVMSIPTLIYSFWGMNVPMPFEHNPLGALYVGIFSVVVSVIITWAMKKGDWF